jgi:trans-aconitate 2-methyltransferase
MSSPWDPALYERFRAQRAQPGLELLGGLEPRPGCRAVDLGCGTGELTAELHSRLEASETLGLDSSETMLARSASREAPGLRFEQRDLGELDRFDPFDVIFSNACIQWVSGHEDLLARLVEHLAPGGTLAFQVPANHRHLSHHLASGLAAEEPYASALGGEVREAPVLTPERYSERLYELGFEQPRVELRVYLHELPEPAGVFDWVSGTLLTWYQSRLPTDLWESYRETYRTRLLDRLPKKAPYPFAFPRVLAWASR